MDTADLLSRKVKQASKLLRHQPGEQDAPFGDAEAPAVGDNKLARRELRDKRSA